MAGQKWRVRIQRQRSVGRFEKEVEPVRIQAALVAHALHALAQRHALQRQQARHLRIIITTVAATGGQSVTFVDPGNKRVKVAAGWNFKQRV